MDFLLSANNSYLFIAHTIIVLMLALGAYRLGKDYLIAFIGISAVLANLYVVKQMDIFGLAATGGNVMYAAIFFSSDILNEFYGKKEAQKAVIVGFFAAFIFLVTSQLLLLYVPNDFDFSQTSYQTLFALTPRIVLGSLTAYLISQNLDIIIFDSLKKQTHGTMLWLRNNASTIVSQFVDSIVFTIIAFAGVLPNEVMLEIILFTYGLKVVVALLDTPFIYLAKMIKRP